MSQNSPPLDTPKALEAGLAQPSPSNAKDTRLSSNSQHTDHETLHTAKEEEDTTPIDDNEKQDPSTALQLTPTQLRRPQSLPKEALFLFVLCSTQLMTQAGLAISIVPAHIIGASFDVTSPGELSWFAAGYSLTVGTFILIAGRFGDVFGHKRFVVAGYIWFAVWCLVAGCAVYSNKILFIFARVMQGIGPAFMLPNAVAIIGRSYPHGRRQEMVFSLFGATAPGGFVLGAVFSSLLSQFQWWPWAYWVMCIALLLFAGLAVVAIPSSEKAEPVPGDEKSASSIWSRLDILGAIVGVAAFVLFNFAWNQGSAVGWTHPYVYSMLIVGSLLIGAFFWIELKVDHPLVPIHLLPVDSAFALACIGAGWSSFGIYILYLINFLEVIDGNSPLLASAKFSVASISGFVAAVTTGYILSRIRPSLVMVIALLAFTTGGVIIATTPKGQIYWAQTFVALIVLPWGMDMSFPAGTILLSRALPREHQGVAASLVNTVVNYSISIGLGIAGTVEFNVMKSGSHMGDTLYGFRTAWYTALGLSGIGLCIALSFFFFELNRSRRERK